MWTVRLLEIACQAVMSERWGRRRVEGGKKEGRRRSEGEGGEEKEGRRRRRKEGREEKEGGERKRKSEKEERDVTGRWEGRGKGVIYMSTMHSQFLACIGM